MFEERIARKYARALFALARSDGQETVVWDDLRAVGEALAADPRLLALLAAPQIPTADKRAVVGAVLADANERVRDFVLLLVNKRRTEQLPGIVEIYSRLLDEHQGVVEATITSAVPLGGADVQRVLARLATLSGRRIRHRLTVDPQIIGGVVVVVGDQIIDHSVRRDLMRLRDVLRAVKVHEAA